MQFLFLDFITDDPDLQAWEVLPVFIFFARMLDVTLGTTRIMLLSRRVKWAVGVLGFVETFLWILTIGQVFDHVSNVAAYFAWAAGFTAGNLLGMTVVEKMAVGSSVVRFITPDNTDGLTNTLKAERIGYTLLDGQGGKGPVHVIFVVTRKKDLSRLLNAVKAVNPDIFYSVEDVSQAGNGIFPVSRGSYILGQLSIFKRK
jgi:uncharacterized protein YebE (UPF0316 family)